jgi:hypothetical protein
MEIAIRNKELEITSPADPKEDSMSGRRGDKSQVRTLHRAFFPPSLLKLARDLAINRSPRRQVRGSPLLRAPLFLFAYEGNNLQK